MFRQALLALALLAALTLPALCANGPAVPEQPTVTIRVMGNSEYLLLAAEVEDPNIIGTNTEPMSQPWQDDCIDFYFDLGNGARPLGPQCFRLAISAAGGGGFSALVGEEGGLWRPNPGWMAGLRYDVGQDGTLNNPQDVDQGWRVEAAIPWRFFGGVARDGATMGFNVVCHVRGENDTFVSWSSKCKREEDLSDPTTWGKLAFTYSGQAAISEGDRAVCPMGPYPVMVDANLKGPEWMVASVLTFHKPTPEYVRPEAPTGTARRAPLLLALYRMDYQGDPALPGAGRGLWDEAGKPLLTDHPREGVTPLFSGLRADWHRTQAIEARRAGIDALVVPWSGAAQAQAWMDPALASLVGALRTLHLEGRNYPLLVPALDVSALSGKDLAADPQPLADLLLSFLRRVPADLRLQLDPATTGGKTVCPVLLGPPAGLVGWSETTFAAVRRECERALGISLAIVAHPDWRSKALQGPDAACAWGDGRLTLDQAGRYSVACLAPGSASPLVARMEGRSYEADWLKVNTLQPDLVVLDSWNDFTRGTEVAPSAEYGVVYADATRTMFTRMVSRRSYQLTVHRATVPETIMPGVPYAVQLVLRNEGFADLKAGPSITMVYRLTSEKDKKVSYHATAAEGLRLAAGQSAPATFTIQAGTAGNPLPPGPYRLTFEVTKSSMPLLSSSWFTRQLSALAFPVTVGNPGPGAIARVLDCGLPDTLTAGSRTPAWLRVRNDGRTAWKGQRLWARWLPLEDDLARPSGEAASSHLPDLKPGQAGIAKLDLAELGLPSRPGRYTLALALAERGPAFHTEPVTVLAPAPRAEVVSSDLSALSAGAPGQVKLVLRNTGGTRWEAGAVRVAAAWLRWDGSPLGAAGEAAVAVSTGPGQAAQVVLPVTPPALPGNYRLSLALAGSEPVTLACLPAAVGGSGLLALDLTKELNVNAGTGDRRRPAGTFDGTGGSFPAEYLPPDLSSPPMPLYPLGYRLGGDALVGFRWPEAASSRVGAVACRNQTLAVEPGAYREVWVVAAGTDPTQGAFSLVYDKGQPEQTMLAVPGWTQPAQDVTIAASTPHRHAIQGDVPEPAYLYAFRLPADPSRTLIGLKLPSNERIRVFAVSALRAQ